MNKNHNSTINSSLQKIFKHLKFKTYIQSSKNTLNISFLSLLCNLFVQTFLTTCYFKIEYLFLIFFKFFVTQSRSVNKNKTHKIIKKHFKILFLS